MIVAPIVPPEVDEVVAVLGDAFHDYPVMRFVLGADDPDYDRRLPVLVGLFVRARVARGGSILGARDADGRLLAAVHARSLADPASAGVALSTEDPANVPLYEHAGYRTLGRNPVAHGLDTWALWRPEEARPA